MLSVVQSLGWGFGAFLTWLWKGGRGGGGGGGFVGKGVWCYEKWE